MFILEIYRVSDSDMEFSASIYLRREWYDPRLRYDHLSNVSEIQLHFNMFDSFWTPNLMFVNERRSTFHTLTLPNRSLRIYPDGRIFLSQRYSVTYACPMSLQKFPMDTQYCKMEMETYSFRASQVTFVWKPNKAVEIPKRLYVPQFHYEGYELQDCTNVYVTGGFSCLRVMFTFRRNLGFHVIASYVPAAFIVIVSWVAFWINPDAVPGRISLGITTVLTMGTQTFVSSLSMPKVPYIKALDVWMTMSLIFVFASLLEFAVVHVLQEKQQKQQRLALAVYKKRDVVFEEIDAEEGNAGIGSESNGSIKRSGTSESIQATTCYRLKNPKNQTIRRFLKNSNKVDKTARIMFPVAYITFAVVYWTYYIMWDNPEEKSEWNIN